MKVAILDDDLLFCEMLKDYLSSYHFDISIFNPCIHILSSRIP